MAFSRRARWTAAVLSRFHHPAQVVVTSFGLLVLAGTFLLMQPISTVGPAATTVEALFTATSAVTVTGLAIVDTQSHWSVFGEVVIAGLVQVGGLGIMTFATLFAVIVGRRVGLRFRLLAQAETSMLSVADVRSIARRVVVFSLSCEAVFAAVLAGRWMIGYGEPFGQATYYGVFHSIMAFNHAGFALWPDSLTRFVADPWISLTASAAVIVGGLGFPVVFELMRTWRRPGTWSIMTRLTVWISLALLAIGTLFLLVAEWNNPKTFGPLDDGGKLLAAFFASTMTRSAGLNSVDIGQMETSSLLVSDVLMFIGGASASTAGGIRVTTFGVLAFVIWAELRGEPRVNIGHRRVADSVQRQAIAISLLSVAVVVVATYVLLVISPFALDQVLFEVISAFTTTGLSTGITAQFSPAGQIVLTLLMFMGRTGTLTLGTALAMQERTRRYELPEERVLVG
ncbi:TrkH family potassium uptake protein [Nonomuraea endophytica]|uniref:Potassium uptake TrkH family protein n=1 Tax=Nonomuraea endophytica TaxID=714136 RepID=A0A7W8A343_9ACTN|nr:potassium transporter TrkG [Nonomuraea endophytica]MBB5078721.1 potassium uptake TrkH family protein [Nonomuraea endophytica]